MEANKYRPVILHLFEVGKKASEIHRELVSIHGEDAPSLSTVQFWVRKFKCGQESTADEQRPGRPKSATSDHSIRDIAQIIQAITNIGIRTIAAQTGCSYGTVHKILHSDLNMQMFSKWVPYALSGAQKQARVDFCRLFLRRFGADFDAKKSILITSDETWVKYATPDSLQSGQEWRIAGSSRPEKVRLTPRSEKVMLTVWWDAQSKV